MNNKEITIELESYADNNMLVEYFINKIKDNFRLNYKVRVRDIK